MNPRRLRSSFATTLLLVLVMSILAACGGGGGTPAAQTAAPVATTVAPAAVATTVAPAAAATTVAPVTEATTAAAEETTAAADTTTTAAPEETTAAADTTAAAGATAGANTEPVGDPNAKSPAGNTIRLNIGTPPDNIDPQQASFVNEIEVIMVNYLPLMTFDENLKPVPGAAESFEVSEDGLTYTFTLRPDQKYSDGEPLTAENFEYAMKRWADPVLAGEYQFLGTPIAGFSEAIGALTRETDPLTVTDTAEIQELIEAVGVNAIDENTLEVRLAQPAPWFLNAMALWPTAPVRQDLIEAGGEAWYTDPANYIGNGPFQMTEHETQSRILFERNENYALTERAPTFDTLEYFMITEGQVAFEAYRNGELDFLGVGAEDLPTVQGDPELSKQLVQTTGSCTFYLAYNHKRPPFEKKEVRQAFAYAFDRETYTRDIELGIRKPTLTFIPPGIPGHDPNETAFAYDPEKARETMAAAGFPEGAGLDIKLTHSATARIRTRFEWIAGRFKEIFPQINITLDPVDPTVYTNLTKSPETYPPMSILGWCADYPDPQNFLSAVFRTGGSASGRISWSNPEFDALVDQADVELDETKRFQLYQQAQDLLIEEHPVSFIYNDAPQSLQQPWISGVNRTPLDYIPGFFGGLQNIKVNH